MRTLLTLIITKCIRWTLRIFHRGGSLPGSIALKLQPDFLTHLTYPDTVIMVTGTNGKTTTSNMLFETVQASGKKVIGNRKGDNLKAGIVTLAAANASLNGKIKADIMVIEVDELNVPKVIHEAGVNVFVINNFFRDQLDRAGEMETILRKMEGVLPDYEGTLVLNGDDPNVVRLAYSAPKANIIYIGAGKNAQSTLTSNEASEGKFCFRCSCALKYHYYQYSHIGKFYCPSHDFGDVTLALEAVDIDFDACTFRVDDMYYKMPQNALFSVYNCMSVLGACDGAGIDRLYAQTVFSTFSLNDGRMEEFMLGERSALLNLVKNPTGANETMKYIKRDLEDKDILILLNDNDQDGCDISWIWDAHFEWLCQDDVKHVICSGKRAYDMALRMKYEGYQGVLEVKENGEEAVKLLKTYPNHPYVIATYTALQPIRAVLGRMK